MNEWHKKFFNELYLNLFMKRTQDMIDKEVSLITSLFPMEEIQSYGCLLWHWRLNK